MLREFKRNMKRIMPLQAYNFLRAIKDWQDIIACLSFLKNRDLGVPLKIKIGIVKQLYWINLNIESPHTQQEMLAFIQTILALPQNSKGVVVEAGCFKGSSTAKFSLAAHLAGKKLVVFDSFQGIPENNEPHDKNIFGAAAVFNKGDYKGSLDEVKSNIARFGVIDACEFIPGWFEDTMPDFYKPVAAVYIDVDLASSTRTCLKYLYPLLSTNGVLYSQDGHLPLVLDVFNDDVFWQEEFGCEKPDIIGMGKSQLISIVKQ